MSSAFLDQISAAGLGPPQKDEPPSEAFIKGEGRGRVWLRRFRLEADFIGFQGHFEGRPVLPALAQVLLARESAEAVAGQALFIEAIAQAKFLSPAVPGDLISVHALPPADGWSGEWRFHLSAAKADGRRSDASFLRLKLRDG